MGGWIGKAGENAEHDRKGRAGQGVPQRTGEKADAITKVEATVIRKEEWGAGYRFEIGANPHLPKALVPTFLRLPKLLYSETRRARLL